MREERDSVVRSDLIRMVRRAELVRPRSLQQAIGPSQMGNPCDRSLGWDAGTGAGVPKHDEIVPQSDPIPSIVGSAVHAWLAEAAVTDDRIRTATQEGPPRWLVEQAVVCTHAGVSVSGSVDLFDRETGTVADWKVVGPTTLRRAKSEGPSTTYRTQVHLYGLGLAQAGEDVRQVAVAMLPRNGPLHDLLFMAEPFDPCLAEAALERLARVTASGWDDLEAEPSDGACRWCAVPHALCVEGSLHR